MSDKNTCWGCTPCLPVITGLLPVPMSSLGMDLNVSLKGYADVVSRRTGTALIAGRVDSQEVSIAQGGPSVFFGFFHGAG